MVTVVERYKAQKAILEYLGRDKTDIECGLLANLVDDYVTLDRTAKWVVDYWWDCDDMRWHKFVSRSEGYEWLHEYEDGARLDHYYPDEDY